MAEAVSYRQRAEVFFLLRHDRGAGVGRVECRVRERGSFVTRTFLEWVGKLGYTGNQLLQRTTAFPGLHDDRAATPTRGTGCNQTDGVRWARLEEGITIHTEKMNAPAKVSVSATKKVGRSREVKAAAGSRKQRKCVVPSASKQANARRLGSDRL